LITSPPTFATGSGGWINKGPPRPKDQENFTDPESGIMKSGGGFDQCDNFPARQLGEQHRDNEFLLPFYERIVK